MFTRRSFLQKIGALGLGLASLSVPSVSQGRVSGKRSLAFYHLHTHQELSITYAWGQAYSPRALRRISYYLRDFRTNEMHAIDPKLLDLLWVIQQQMGCRGAYEVISGYRSPKTNAKLRRRSFGVAKKSLHMEGKAIDVRFSGVETNQIQQCAIDLQCCGVGYYAKSDFVHLDTGQYRTW